MSPLQAKIDQLRAKNEAARRDDLIHMGTYFNESSWWWFAEAMDPTERWPKACRQSALESAAASHLSALTLIIHEENPL